MDFLKFGNILMDKNHTYKITLQATTLFELLDEVLYFSDFKHGNQRHAVAPWHRQEQLLQDGHGGLYKGHFFRNQFYNTLYEHWCWPGMYLDAMAFCEVFWMCNCYWNMTTTQTAIKIYTCSETIPNHWNGWNGLAVYRTRKQTCYWAGRHVYQVANGLHCSRSESRENCQPHWWDSCSNDQCLGFIIDWSRYKPTIKCSVWHMCYAGNSKT